MAASSKRICEVCRGEFVPSADQFTAIEINGMLTVTRRHLEDEADFCGDACLMKHLSERMAAWRKQSMETRELERMVKE